MLRKGRHHALNQISWRWVLLFTVAISSGWARVLDELKLFNHLQCRKNDRSDLAPQLVIRQVFRSSKPRLTTDVTITTHLTMERSALYILISETLAYTSILYPDSVHPNPIVPSSGSMEHDEATTFLKEETRGNST